MKAEKKKFDAMLGKLLKAKPVPKDEIKARAKDGAKTPIFSKP
jgi:hypothetical protein